MTQRSEKRGVICFWPLFVNGEEQYSINGINRHRYHDVRRRCIQMFNGNVSSLPQAVRKTHIHTEVVADIELYQPLGVVEAILAVMLVLLLLLSLASTDSTEVLLETVFSSSVSPTGASGATSPGAPSSGLSTGLAGGG